MIRFRAFFFALPTLLWSMAASADFLNTPPAVIASVDLFHASGRNWSSTPSIKFAGYHSANDGGGGAVYALGVAGCADNSGDILKDAAGNCFYATQPVQNLAQWGARCDAQNITSGVTLATSAPQITLTTPLNTALRDGTAKVAITDGGAAYATFTSTILSTDGTGELLTTAGNPTQSGALFISTKTDQIVAPDGTWLNLPITNATNDGGIVQITVASTAAMTNGLTYQITGVNMTVSGTSSPVNAPWVANIIDGTHFDLIDSLWTTGDSYINGGQTNRASYGTGFKTGDSLTLTWDGVTPMDTIVVKRTTDGGINTNTLGGTQGAKLTSNVLRGSQSTFATVLSTTGSGAINSLGVVMRQGRVFQLWAGHDDGAAINNAFASVSYDLYKPSNVTCATTIPLVLPPSNSMLCNRSASTDFIALADITGNYPAGQQYTMRRANQVSNGGGMSGCSIDAMKLSVAAFAVLGGQQSVFNYNSAKNGQVHDAQCGVAQGTGIQITQDKFNGNKWWFDQNEFPVVSQQTPIDFYDFGTCSGNYFDNTTLSGGVIAWDDEAGFNTIKGCESQQNPPYAATTGLIVGNHTIESGCLFKENEGSSIVAAGSSANITNNRLIPDPGLVLPTTYGVEIASGVSGTIITGNEVPTNSGLPVDQVVHADGAIGSDNLICNPGAAFSTCLNGNSRLKPVGNTDMLSLLDETVNWASTNTSVKSEIVPACSASTTTSGGGVSVSVYGNTGTLINLTVSSTSKLIEGATYTIANVNASSNGQYPIHIVDGTHLTLTGSLYYASDSYSGSGGSVGSGTVSVNKQYFINDDNGSGGNFATHNLTAYTITGTINGASTYVATSSFRMTCDGVGNYAVK